MPNEFVSHATPSLSLLTTTRMQALCGGRHDHYWNARPPPQSIKVNYSCAFAISSSRWCSQERC